jgi:hypothetical protein
MPLEIYTIVVAVLAAISLIWWVLSEVLNLFEKRRNNSLWKIIKEQDQKIKELQNENSEYYNHFGIIPKSREK